ncbi:MAG: alanine--tRNA ligase [Candidatus Parvarchaeota archaeon]|nr:alanine--tRNA ligase [Candidatus Parvarchaeota archaeon]MCL5106540.1 alanine--tRNA ligase [Candidatus Parvarchaeota archaeon]
MEKKEVEEIIKKRMQEKPDELIPAKSLLELGLKRYKCKVCGKNFWSFTEKDKCGDVDCVGEYTFFNKKISSLKAGYRDIWRAFSIFFRKTGHKEIKRYPVVARWRDDIYFVEAAIDDFAPYVIKGIAEPPANPLVVPQICLRFNDINNVGLSGRHLTSFIMAEEAAFNTKKKKTYFDREAIKYITEWILNGLKIKKEELTFIEDAWVGAGYAGSCLEYFAGGLELGNQVYMRYVINDDKLEEIPTKTIDMGAGLERWSWVSNNTPTIYEATFPKVIEYIKKKVGVDYDEEKVKQVYEHIGKMDFEKMEVGDAIKTVAEDTKMDEHEIKKILSDMQAVYSIADHSRTLLVAIHDGALPSNVGGGYNLRNILRRTLNFIRSKNWDLDINEVIEEHKKEFGSWFEELKGTETRKIIDKEIERYNEFRDRNYKFISSLLNRTELSEKQMMELYESKGITIDDVKTVAETEGKQIILPEKFYSDINKAKKKKEEKADYSFINGMKPTKKLFYDEKLKKSKAKVVKTIKPDRLILDQTIFYPEMGGQKSDRGKINGSNVINVEIKDDVIIHYLDDVKGFKEKQEIKMEIDSERRELLRRHHTATHIINQACRRVLGDFVYQNGAEKDVDKAHLDITYFDKLTEEQVNRIERLANEVVSENLGIKAVMMPREKAESMYGMSIYQGGVVPNANIRIVKIDDYDVEACGGLHCNSTGEVGLIKIIKTERIQDGVVRVVFKAYKPALEYVEALDKMSKDLTELWGVNQEEIYKTANRFFSESKSYKESYKNAESDRILSQLGLLSPKKVNNITEIETKLNDFGLFSSLITSYKEEVIIFGESIGIGKPKNEAVKSELSERYKVVVEKGNFLLGHN